MPNERSRMSPAATKRTNLNNGTRPPRQRLTVLKVLVQPVLVLVDGDDVREVTHPVVEIKGVDWAEWAASVFTPESLELMRQNVQPVTPEGQ